MKYKVYNEWNDIANGTCYQGCINITYFELVDIFGEADLQGSGDGKVQAEWIIEFENGQVATIYDMREECSYESVTDWHIGGKNFRVVSEIDDIVKKHIDKECLVC